MASTNLILYALNAVDLKQAIGQKDQMALNQMPNKETKTYLEKIFKKEYWADPETGEHPQGDKFISAFNELCRLKSVKELTFECSIDDEQTPELWNFVWSDWEPENFLSLPLSPYGIPAVTYKGPDTLKKYINIFTEIKVKGGFNPKFLTVENLNQLLEFLNKADLSNLGVIIFISE